MSGVHRFVLATANPDKAQEIREVLETELSTRGLQVELVARPGDVPDVVEDGATLEDNARLKAVALAEATGLAAIADDTGLEVDALEGAPGVHSARYAGEDATYEDNCTKLLEELAGVAPERRTARFATVALVRWPDGVEVAALGTVDGVIAEAPSGVGGFGYDPLFIPESSDRTFAQMTAHEKHSRSHRGDAFRTLAQALAAVLPEREPS